jgi:8-oxo-dGTP diphosphatase
MTPPGPSCQRHVTTLVYAVHAGRLLLLHRRKAPNLGRWSPPGGKLEPGETPLQGALRELGEETGLDGMRPRLAAVVSEVDPVRREAWLMFAVRVDVAADGPLRAGTEGEAAWVALEDVPKLDTPPADAHILAAVLADRAPGVAFLDARYDDGRLVAVTTDWG